MASRHPSSREGCGGLGEKGVRGALDWPPAFLPAGPGPLKGVCALVCKGMGWGGPKLGFLEKPTPGHTRNPAYTLKGSLALPSNASPHPYSHPTDTTQPWGQTHTPNPGNVHTHRERRHTEVQLAVVETGSRCLPRLPVPTRLRVFLRWVVMCVGRPPDSRWVPPLPTEQVEEGPASTGPESPSHSPSPLLYPPPPPAPARRVYSCSNPQDLCSV